MNGYPKNMNTTDKGRIAEGFELTGYEMQVLSNVVNFCSGVRDAEYAPRASCFMDAYGKVRPFPRGDMAELLTEESDSRFHDHELPPEDLLARERRRERNRVRRRGVVDDVLRRAKYVPTPEELAEYDKFAAMMEARRKEHHDLVCRQRELMAK